MKLFTEWLREGAGIATSRSQCVQGDQPNFAGACSNLPPSPKPKKKRKKLKKIGSKLKKFRKKKDKDEATAFGGEPGIGAQGGGSDAVMAGAG